MHPRPFCLVLISAGTLRPRPGASPAGDFSFHKGQLDHRIADQSSILRFIEDNRGLGRLGGGSADEKAGTLNGFFDFDDSRNIWLLLDAQTGQVLSTH